MPSLHRLSTNTFNCDFLIYTASTALRAPSSTSQYHLDNVDCNGNEYLLSECVHARIGFSNCLLGQGAAGVLCNSEFCTAFSVSLIILLF